MIAPLFHIPMEPDHRKTNLSDKYIIYYLGGAVLVLFGISQILIIFLPLNDLRKLASDPMMVKAQVIETRLLKKDVASPYNLLYQFRLTAGGPIYIAMEDSLLGRRKIHSAVNKAQWDEAKRTGYIDVYYYPPDPYISCLAVNLHQNLRSAWFVLAIGISFIFGGVALPIYSIRKAKASERRHLPPAK